MGIYSRDLSLTHKFKVVSTIDSCKFMIFFTNFQLNNDQSSLLLRMGNTIIDYQREASCFGCSRTPVG